MKKKLTKGYFNCVCQYSVTLSHQQDIAILLIVLLLLSTMSTKKPSAINVVFEDDDNHERLLYSGETTLSPGKFREEPTTALATGTFHAILYPYWNLEGGKQENKKTQNTRQEPTTNSITYIWHLGHIGRTRRQVLSPLHDLCSLN